MYYRFSWGEEAFKKSKNENTHIFLYIGVFNTTIWQTQLVLRP